MKKRRDGRRRWKAQEKRRRSASLKRRELWKLAAVILAAMGGAGIILAFCVFHGFVLINHPSKNRYPVRGVDVSHYQGEIDWKILSGQGIDFAYIKATEGSSHTDPEFTKNWLGAQSVDLKAGAYHFFSFDSQGADQLLHFIQTVPDSDQMLPPAVDFEFYGDKKANPPDKTAAVEQLKILLEGLEAYYEVRPVLYATEDSWEMYLQEGFEDYPLWIRNVIRKPQIDQEWFFWQFTNRARLKGYKGQEKFIDMNVFAGDREEWEAWAHKSGNERQENLDD